MSYLRIKKKAIVTGTEWEKEMVLGEEVGRVEISQAVVTSLYFIA